MQINLLTTRQLNGLYKDDQILLKYLQKNSGLEVNVINWEDYQEEYEGFKREDDINIVRSCWNYCEHIGQFEHALHWMGGTLYNKLETIKWNLDKIYLNEFPWSYPTSYDGHASFDKEFGNTYVVKPRISNGGTYVTKISKKDFRPVDPKLFLVQPYNDTIKDLGEISLIFIEDKFSHAVSKRPAANDFRVQHYYGGSYTKLDNIENDSYLTGLMKLAYQTIDLLKSKGLLDLYCRLDFMYNPLGSTKVTHDDFFLSEIEMIEPLLHFNLAPECAEMIAKAIL